MPPPVWYSYAVIRVVPRVERDEFLNAGVILFARTARFLGARIALDHTRLAAFAPGIDAAAMTRHLKAIVAICEGGENSGPIARLPQSERFAWLTAPRSALIQLSPVHVGYTDDPPATLDALYDALVRVPGA